MPNYGVIDLGSNSIRMVIYEVKREKPGDSHHWRLSYDNEDFKSLINDKIIAGLAAYVTDGVFSDEGIERAASILRGHARRANYFECKKLEVFATAVLRNAKNCKQAVKTIEKLSGLPISVLSESDEAHLGFLGITCDQEVDHGTLIDIGGGSTELTRIQNGGDLDNVSLGQGSLSSFSNFVSGILPTPEEAQNIANAFRTLYYALPDPQRYNTDAVYGIGGSVRAASKMHAQIRGDIERPRFMTKDDILAILEFCYRDANSFAHTALKASPERIHTLVPGCIILLTLLEELGAHQLEICNHGVREGYLMERMLS